MDDRPPPVTGNPLVCGALGPYSADRLAAVRTALERDPVAAPGTSLREFHATERSALLADRDPIAWTAGEVSGFAWAEAAPGPARAPRDRADAAALGCCGLVLDGDEAIVHSSVSGVGPLHWLTRDGAVYFCTRIEPLLAAGDPPFEADVAAWASILTIGYPMGDETPFREVRRLAPSATLGADGVATEHPWPWAEFDPDPGPGQAGEILDALRADLARLPAEHPPILPLSGGWDSRLLGCLIAERGIGTTAVTFNSDQGRAEDERLATAVAAELGLEHELFEAGAGSYAEDFRWSAEAHEYLCPLHLPGARLARRLEPSRRPILEGFAGDMLIKALYIWPEIAAATSLEGSLERTWSKFVRDENGTKFLEDGLWSALSAAGRTAIHREGERFRGHEIGANLALYWTRSRRMIAPSPVDLFGQAGPVALPFIANDVALASLAGPLERRGSGELYREVLELANPVVARLPSSNDAERDHGAAVPQLRNSPEALEFYASVLADHPLRDRFAQPLTRGLERGKMKRFARGGGRFRMVQSLVTFGLWHERYRDRIKPVDFSVLD
jgi:hypothetical protein